MKKIDLAFIQIDPCHLHPNAVSQTETAPPLLSGQLMAYRIKVVVVVLQCSDMDQSIHKDLIQCDKEAKTGDPTHHTIKLLSHVVHHVFTFQPLGRIPGCIIGPSLGCGTLLSEAAHILPAVTKTGAPLFHHRANHSGIQQVSYGTMDQQIGITTDRRGEVGVVVVSKPKVADTLR